MRRLSLFAFLLCIASPFVVAVPQSLKISIEPGTIYKREDPGHDKTESWYFWLLVQDDAEPKLEPIQISLLAYKGSELIESKTIEASTLKSAQLHSFTADEKTSKYSPLRKAQRPELYDFKLHMTEPIAAAADSIVVTFVGRTPSGKKVSEQRVSVSSYRQKTKVIFPFRGNGIVSQGSINDGGHANFANQYALDILGLTEETYGPQTRDKDEDEAYAGWGREIIAPADGIVVYTRNDVPDNVNVNQDPDPTKWEALPDPGTVIAGNCVIVDHLNGEYSVMMHMRQGSVKVRKGDKVKAGQAIGNLGNSGDAYGPHLHYQLQNGPELFAYPPVPVVFSNALWGKPMYRGSYFRTH